MTCTHSTASGVEMSTQAIQVSRKYKMPGSSGIPKELPLTTKDGIYYHVHFAEGNKNDKKAHLFSRA